MALPPTDENRAFVVEYLTQLAQNVDVVLLSTGHQFDDHQDFPPGLRGRLHSIEHLMTPETNLAVQTEVIRHAEAFVGRRLQIGAAGGTWWRSAPAVSAPITRGTSACSRRPLRHLH